MNMWCKGRSSLLTLRLLTNVSWNVDKRLRCAADGNTDERMNNLAAQITRLWLGAFLCPLKLTSGQRARRA